MSNESNRFRADQDGNIINAVREIADVKTFALTTSAWTPIIVPTGVNCKSIVAKTRSENAWRLTKAGDGDYMKIDHVFELDIAQGPGVQLFVAMADATNDTLEVLFLD